MNKPNADMLKALEDLEAQAAARAALDTVEVEKLREEYHTALPHPYRGRWKLETILPTVEYLHELEGELAADASLSHEQGYVLGQELFERWQNAALRQAGQGFND